MHQIHNPGSREQEGKLSLGGELRIGLIIMILSLVPDDAERCGEERNQERPRGPPLST